jgi:hypothetical protein
MTPEPEEVLARYHAVRNAVAFCELVLDAVHARGSLAGGMPLDGILEALREEVDCLIDERGAWDHDTLLLIRHQIDMPEFRVYLAAKLGMA